MAKNCGTSEVTFLHDWKSMKKVLENNKFKLVYSNMFKWRDVQDPDVPVTYEEEVIYCLPSKGIVVYANSYGNRDTLNDGAMYMEIEAKDKECDLYKLSNVSIGPTKDKNNNIIGYEIKYDLRDKPIQAISDISKVAVFKPVWEGVSNKFVWFVNYEESKVSGYSWKKISLSKIAKAKPELRKIIGESMRDK